MASSGVARTMSMAVVLFLFAAGVGFSSAAVYKVGDSVGWTTIGNFNYAAWASKKTFHVGDTLLFEYNTTYHNVMEVSKADYGQCNVGSPISKYATGNDSITMNTAGHRYFLCGFPGHCAAGQKVDILVLKNGSSAAPSASPNSSPSVPPSTLGGSSGSSAPSAAPKASTAPITSEVLSLVVSALTLASFIYNLCLVLGLIGF